MSTMTQLDVTLCMERLTRYQQEQRLSDAAMARRCPELGSARTWRRMVNGQWADLPLDTWAPRLQAAVASIDPAGDLPSTVLRPPLAEVTRHLTEADHCRREGNLPLARSHCRVARRAIEDYQRALAPTEAES